MMIVCGLRNALVAALLTALLITAEHHPSISQSLGKSFHDATLAPLPGVKFIRPLRNARPRSEKVARGRFRKAKYSARVYAYDGPASGHLSASNILGGVQRRTGGTGYENITATTAYGTQYGVKVTFGHQHLMLDLNTGSADTWAVAAKSNCTAGPGGCFFGPAYAGRFTGGAIRDEHLYLSFGDGELIRGPLGYMDVTIGGIQVENQVVALANITLWKGNNVTSGVLGLAYPALTKAYEGGFDKHDPWYQREYQPIFSSMIAQGLVENFFSIAINRNSSDGAIGFGGIPDGIEGVDYDTEAVTDIIIANVAKDDSTTSEYSYYTIIPDGWVFGSSTDERKLAYIIDSATTLIYVPPELAKDINASFDPPAEYSHLYGGYFTTCDAREPRIGVVIDGTFFELNPKDLLLRHMKDPITGLCMTSFADGGTGPYILGDVFLQNVLAVFDIDNSVMQFASRRFY